MTTRYTQDEWIAIFDEAEQTLPGRFPEYKVPAVGSAAFANTIDHTILKLGATQEDIDRLCVEARKHLFKVRRFMHHKFLNTYYAISPSTPTPLQTMLILQIVGLRTPRVGPACC